MIILNKSNFKIYIIILFFSIFIVMLGINMYINAKSQIINILDKNKAVTSENIVNSFQIWLNERVDSLVAISKFIENEDVIDDDKKIKKLVKTFLEESNNFDLIQFLTEDGKVYINGDLYMENETENRNLIWYIDTKDNNMPTVNFMPKHAILNEGTLNLCVPNYKDGTFVAILCGIVKLKSIFNNINNFKLSPNSYSFIITHSGEILTHMNDEELKNKIQEKFSEMLLVDEDIESLTIGSNFISISSIPSLNWFIGAGTDNAVEANKFLSAITKDAVILLFSFIMLAFIANSLHNFMYKKIKARKDEYEILLTHQAKMTEAGELISGMNHQFIQPVNSLNIMISTLLMLKKENRLNEEILENMLEKGQRSITLLKSTIDIFRNFYKISENIKNFSIRQSILNLITLMHTELSRANVYIVLNEFKDKEINQIENIIQQILLILIHNAKDALLDKYKDDIINRKIEIDVSFDNKKCYIKVVEFGSGVSEEINKKIFSEPKTTKEFGNGIGLYFGKKLANEKINGDIRLLNKSNPTVFELNFDINLKDNNANK